MVLLYRPLDKSSDELRLLTLHPGKGNSSIHCNLTHVPLGEYSKHSEGIYRWSDGHVWPLDQEVGDPNLQWVSSYEALSYTWGDQSIRRPVDVDGHTVDVGLNLFSALQTLRKRDKPRVLWVDALCIDQSNLQERSEQVQRMRAIYQRAIGVLIWLGEASDDSDLAMDLVERMGGSREDLAGFRWEHYDWVGPQYRPFYLQPPPECQSKWEKRQAALAAFMDSLKRLKPSDIDEAGWVALDRFFNGRNWWMRTWVIQEAANAQNITIFCGAKSLDWETVLHLTLYSPDPYHARLNDLLHKGGVVALVNQREATREASRAFGFELESRSFLKLLTSFRTFQATDPRDKVYALLGLASMSREMPFPAPDYTKSVRHVFCEAALALIENRRDLGVLCLTHSTFQESAFGLPSWAPDWTIQPDSYEFFDPSWSESRYTASKDRKAEGPALQPLPLESQRKRPEDNLMVYYVNRKSNTSADGLINRPAPTGNKLLLAEDMSLSLDGVCWDDIDQLGEYIPTESLETDEWKAAVRRWEPEGIDADPAFHPRLVGARPFYRFWMTLMRENVFIPHSLWPQYWLDIYHNQYLALTGRVPPAEAEDPTWAETFRGHPGFANIFNLSSDIKNGLVGWRFCVTSRGYMGMVPAHSEKGDKVSVLFGADVPLIMRQISETGGRHFRLIGAAYVYGIMHGEAMDELDKGNLQQQTFTLI